MRDRSEAAALMGMSRAGSLVIGKINRFLGRVNGALNLYFDIRDDF
jgi:hypothetical protein